jgi:hypothetical protein
MGRGEVGDALHDIRRMLSGAGDVDELRRLEGVAADDWWSG